MLTCILNLDGKKHDRYFPIAIIESSPMAAHNVGMTLLSLRELMADPEFSVRQPTTWQNLCRKLHENERIWTGGEERAQHPPWIMSLDVFQHFL